MKEFEWWRYGQASPWSHDKETEELHQMENASEDGGSKID